MTGIHGFFGRELASTEPGPHPFGMVEMSLPSMPTSSMNMDMEARISSKASEHSSLLGQNKHNKTTNETARARTRKKITNLLLRITHVRQITICRCRPSGSQPADMGRCAYGIGYKYRSNPGNVCVLLMQVIRLPPCSTS